MRKTMYVQYATMIAICFMSGVACYQLFELQEAMQVIKWADSRLLTLEKPSILASALPVFLSIIIVLFFSTHSFLAICAQIFVGIKITFFGFSSVFLLVQDNSIKLYGLWWFPFQLIYCILLIVLCTNISTKNSTRGFGHRMRKGYSLKRVLTIILIILIVFIAEIVAISYVFI